MDYVHHQKNAKFVAAQILNTEMQRICAIAPQGTLKLRESVQSVPTSALLVMMAI